MFVNSGDSESFKHFSNIIAATLKGLIVEHAFKPVVEELQVFWNSRGKWNTNISQPMYCHQAAIS